MLLEMHCVCEGSLLLDRGILTGQLDLFLKACFGVDSYHKIEDGRFFLILVYNDRTWINKKTSFKRLCTVNVETWKTI